MRNGAGGWRAPPCPKDPRNQEGIPAHEILGISQGRSFRRWWAENELTFQGRLWRSLSPLSSWPAYTTSHLAAGLSPKGSREQYKSRRSGGVPGPCPGLQGDSDTWRPGLPDATFWSILHKSQRMVWGLSSSKDIKPWTSLGKKACVTTGPENWASAERSTWRPRSVSSPRDWGKTAQSTWKQFLVGRREGPGRPWEKAGTRSTRLHPRLCVHPRGFQSSITEPAWGWLRTA